MNHDPAKKPSLLERLEQGDREVLVELYRENERMIKKYVLENNGDTQDAEDLLQEALVVLWQNARKPDFKLEAKASTYLFAVVRNLWLKQLDKRKRNTKLEDSHEQTKKTEDKHATFDLALVRKELNSMGDLCRKILLMYFFDGYDMKTIAEANNLSNANTAKSKKYQCLKELTNQVKSQYQKSDFL